MVNNRKRFDSHFETAEFIPLLSTSKHLKLVSNKVASAISASPEKNQFIPHIQLPQNYVSGFWFNHRLEEIGGQLFNVIDMKSTERKVTIMPGLMPVWGYSSRCFAMSKKLKVFANYNVVKDGRHCFLSLERKEFPPHTVIVTFVFGLIEEIDVLPCVGLKNAIYDCRNEIVPSRRFSGFKCYDVPRGVQASAPIGYEIFQFTRDRKIIKHEMPMEYDGEVILVPGHRVLSKPELETVITHEDLAVCALYTFAHRYLCFTGTYGLYAARNIFTFKNQTLETNIKSGQAFQMFESKIGICKYVDFLPSVSMVVEKEATLEVGEFVALVAMHEEYIRAGRAMEIADFELSGEQYQSIRIQKKNIFSPFPKVPRTRRSMQHLF